MSENKPTVCIRPYEHGCYDCEYNMVPGLYDGGCKLLSANDKTDHNEAQKPGKAV